MTDSLVWLRATHVCREHSFTRAATGRRNVIERPLAEILKRLVSGSSQLPGAQPAFAYERVVLLFRYPRFLFDGRGVHVLSQLLHGAVVFELFAEPCPFQGLLCVYRRHVRVLVVGVFGIGPVRDVGVLTARWARRLVRVVAWGGSGRFKHNAGEASTSAPAPNVPSPNRD